MTATTYSTITISRDGVWAGTGRLTSEGSIEDCSAVLGANQDASDETYAAIEEAIADEPESSTGEVVRPDGTYEWSIETTVAGCTVQHDASGGQGHAWRSITARELAAIGIQQEIEEQIIDGGRESGEIVASNGQHYRWS